MILDFVDCPMEHGAARELNIWAEIRAYVETRNRVLPFAEKIILYHGTSSNFEDKISREGVTPRIATNNSVWTGKFSDRKEFGGANLESQEDLVYLGNYEVARRLGAYAKEKFGGELVVFRACLELPELLPDEDSGKKTALESLARKGSCAITVVQPEKLLGVYSNIRFNSGHQFKDYKQLRQEPENVLKLDHRKMDELGHPEYDDLEKTREILMRMSRCKTDKELEDLIETVSIGFQRDLGRLPKLS